MKSARFALATLAMMAAGAPAGPVAPVELYELVGAEGCGTRMVSNGRMAGRPHDPKKRAKAKAARKARRRNR